MALKVELKPGERIIIGESVVTNDDQRTRLFIQGTAPILRERDIMTPERADSPAKRIYLAVQLMYTSRDRRAHHDIYFALVREIIQAAPTIWPYIEGINNRILTGEMYKALKEAKRLIAYEQKLLDDAKRSAGVQQASNPHLVAATSS
jgi:flagellar biosynthesis repressor protein FlbT